MAVDLLGDLTEDLGDVGSDYEIILERMQDGGELDEADVQVSPVVIELTTAIAKWGLEGSSRYRICCCCVCAKRTDAIQYVLP
jgi:hypothetical protein